MVNVCRRRPHARRFAASFIECSEATLNTRTDHLKATHVRAQHFGHDDGAIGLLVILQNGDDDARQGQAGTVERMDEFRFFPFRGPIANIGPSGLEIPEEGTGTAFEPLL